MINQKLYIINKGVFLSTLHMKNKFLYKDISYNDAVNTIINNRISKNFE